MKTLRTTFAAVAFLLMASSMNAQPMSYESMRYNARFLTDRMAYTLGLDAALLDDLYYINYDYICGVNDYLDDVAYGYRYDDYNAVLLARDLALQALLTPYQWSRLMAIDYFYRPISFYSHRWRFGIYAYDSYNRFYYGAPWGWDRYYGGHFFGGMHPGHGHGAHFRGGHFGEHGRGGHFYDKPGGPGPGGPGGNYSNRGGGPGNRGGNPGGGPGNRGGNQGGGPGNHNGGYDQGNNNHGGGPGNHNGGYDNSRSNIGGRSNFGNNRPSTPSNRGSYSNSRGSYNNSSRPSYNSSSSRPSVSTPSSSYSRPSVSNGRSNYSRPSSSYNSRPSSVSRPSGSYGGGRSGGSVGGGRSSGGHSGGHVGGGRPGGRR